MPLYQLLTDRTLAEASAITPTTLIHIVTTADTRQNIAGSSYKVELGQLAGLFSGSTFSGGSGNCITDLYVSNLYGCSPITVWDNLTLSGSVIDAQGGGYLDLRYGNDGIFYLGNDNGAYSDTFIYGESGYLEISAYDPNGKISMFTDGGNAGITLTNSTFPTFDLSLYTNTTSITSNPSGGDIGNLLEIKNDNIFHKSNIGTYILSDSGTTFGVGVRADFLVRNKDLLPVTTDTVNNTNPTIISSRSSTLQTGVTNTVIIGGSNITATQSNTAYVDKFNIKTIGSGTSVINLGLDVNGNVVTGTTGGGTFTGGTVSGSTNFTNGLTTTTVSATTYQNLPISGTHNYLSKFSSGSTILVDSQIRDNGSTVGLGIPPNVNAKLYVATSSEPYGLGAENQATNGVGVFGQAAALGNTTGVAGLANGTATSNIGVNGQANEATTNIGLRGYAFNGTNNYSIQLLDGTEGIGKVLTSVTSDGKANWQTLPSATFTGGVVSGATNFTNGLTATTVSATTYLNLPTDIRVTGGTYSAGTITLINNTGGTFNVTGITNNQIKEVFFKGSETNPAYIGNFYAGTCNGGTDAVYIHGSIPNDLSSMVSAEVITIPTFSGNVSTDIDVQYGPVNSFYSATTITAAPTYSYNINKFTSLDVLPYMSGITSNDVFGISVFQNDTNLFVLGMKIKYT